MSKVILITGTSSGFGRTIAEKLHFEGYTVIGTSRNAEKISSDYLTIKLDINDYEASKSEVDQIINKYGKIDILINNAGVGVTGPLEETSSDDIKKAFKTNLFGPIEIIKKCIPSMRNEKKGLIINITSILAYFGTPFRGVYSATKSSLEIIGEVFNMELNKFNINVVNIAPGDFKTDIASRRIVTKLKESSFYFNDYNNSLKSVNTHVNKAKSPIEIAHLVFKIIKSNNPKIHYKAGSFIQKFSIILKRIMPDRLFQKLLLHYSKN